MQLGPPAQVAVNDSVRVLRETFRSRCYVVKLFTTPIRRYNGAAVFHVGFTVGTNEPLRDPREEEHSFYETSRALLPGIPLRYEFFDEVRNTSYLKTGRSIKNWQ
ncbi:hypothetical protein V1477_011965 [Vespula maculifrons]|uniref:Uncharacterized protein n=1 Tax=Vespula maculifrons TaxID=7453 RepID=A0ABD2C0P8_VESMC